MTAVCGLAQEFWQTGFAARVGVGIGRGGLKPPRHTPCCLDLYRRNSAPGAMST